MKIRLEIEINDDSLEDIQAILVAELYEQCVDWIENDKPPLLQFIISEEEINATGRLNYAWGNIDNDIIN